MTLYFAYGSNMSIDQMTGRCPAAVRVGRAALSDHDFALNHAGHATVVVAPGHVTYGALWDLSVDCEESLDRFEGVSRGTYKRRQLSIEGDQGSDVIALVYVAADAEGGPASPLYADTVLIGAADFELPPAWIRRLEGALRVQPVHLNP